MVPHGEGTAVLSCGVDGWNGMVVLEVVLLISSWDLVWIEHV